MASLRVFRCFIFNALSYKKQNSVTLNRLDHLISFRFCKTLQSLYEHSEELKKPDCFILHCKELNELHPYYIYSVNVYKSTSCTFQLAYKISIFIYKSLMAPVLSQSNRLRSDFIKVQNEEQIFYYQRSPVKTQK